MKDAYQHCETLVRERDRDRFLATLFAPVEKRAHLFALYAFDLEISRVPDAVREPMAGEIRLQWWRDVLSGERAGEAQANPVAAALLDTLRHHPLSSEALGKAIDARAFDLVGSPMPTRAALDDYLNDTSATTMAAAAAVLAPEWDRGPVSRAGGRASGIVKLLQNIGPDVAKGQVLIPLDLLAKHEVHTASVLAGEMSAGLRQVLDALCAEAEGCMEQLRKSDVPEKAAPAFLVTALVPASLALIRRTPDPFRARMELSGLRSQFLLWRAAKRGAI